MEFTVTGTYGPLIGKEVLVRYSQGSEERYEVLLTDSQGKVRTSLIKTTLASPVEVDIAVNSVVDVVTIPFGPDEKTAHVSGSVHILQNNQLANNQAKAEVLFTIVDAYNNPIPNFAVTAEASNHATLDVSSLVTDTEGKVKFSLTNAYSGITKVTATSNNTTSIATLEFLPVLKVDNPEVIVTAKSYTAGKNPVSVTSSFSGTQQWSIQPSLPQRLQLDSATGKISGTVESEYGIPATNYTLFVRDSHGTRSSSASFALVVNPPFVISQKLYRRVLSTDSQVNIQAFGITGGEPPYEVTVSPALPSNLSVSNTGVILGRTTATTIGEKEYTFTVTDQQKEQKNIKIQLSVVTGAQITVVVKEKMLTKDTSTTQGNSSYIPIKATPSAADGAVSFTGITPALPKGINLNSTTGEITGTPTEESSLQVYTMTVRDGKSGAESQVDFELGVAPSFVAQQSTYQKILGVNTSVSFPICSLSGGVIPYDVTITPNLPNGLQLDAKTGIISGIPTDTGQLTEYTVTVTDANKSPRPNMRLSLTVANVPTVTDKEPNKVAVVGSYLNYTPLSATSAVTGKSVTFTNISPALPAGLSWRSSDGSIYGTPQAVTSQDTFTFTIRDGGTGAEIQKSFKLSVFPKLTFSQKLYNKTLIAGTYVDIEVLSITNGSGDYELVDQTSLPSGLSLDLEGTGASRSVKLKGTPTSSQTEASYTFQVKDRQSGLFTGSRTLKLTVSGGKTFRRQLSESVLFDYIRQNQIPLEMIQERHPSTVGLGIGASVTFKEIPQKNRVKRKRDYKIRRPIIRKRSFVGNFEKAIRMIKLGGGIADSRWPHIWGRDVLFTNLSEKIPTGMSIPQDCEIKRELNSMSVLPIFVAKD
ncbi:MAG: putative Ig domain-containing protein [Chlamydia sp.]|nr:putative Ig domain-containing protein [Chlamydia sp.]